MPTVTQLVTVRAGTCTLVVLAFVSIIITAPPHSCPLVDINAHKQFMEIHTKLLIAFGSEMGVKGVHITLFCLALNCLQRTGFFNLKICICLLFKRKVWKNILQNVNSSYIWGAQTGNCLPSTLTVRCCLNFIQWVFAAFVSRKR